MQAKGEEPSKTSLALNIAAGRSRVVVDADPPDFVTGLHERQPLPGTSISLLEPAARGLQEALAIEIETYLRRGAVRTLRGIQCFDQSCRTEVLDDGFVRLAYVGCVSGLAEM